MSALGTQGKEGALRAKYVDQLEIHQEKLQQLAQQEEALTAEIANMKAELDAQMTEYREIGQLRRVAKIVRPGTSERQFEQQGGGGR